MGHPEPLGVYIHFPFCRSRCGYCDFPTSATKRIPQRAYTDALLGELRRRAESYQGRRIASIYLGGGTPSLWRPAQAERLLSAALGAFQLGPDGVEVTAEVNPGDITPRLMAGLAEAGVNRISVGVQAMDDRLLADLGRRHTAQQARRAVADARGHGIRNISCDLIFGLPGQTVAGHLEQLERILSLEPEHLSTYALTLAEGSQLSKHGWREASPDLLADMMDAGRELMAARGLPQYEVSNFAPPSRRSRHNLLYWQGAPILGLGAHAHSTLPHGQRTRRAVNSATRGYLAAQPEQWEEVNLEAARFEMIFLGLRTVRGIDRGAFRKRFGVDPAQLHQASFQRMQDAGLVRIDEASIAPTERGIWLADELALSL